MMRLPGGHTYLPAEAAAKGIDWALLPGKLPHGTTPLATRRRATLWAQIDTNGQGYVTLSELRDGLLLGFKAQDVETARPVMHNAFQLIGKLRQAQGVSS